MKILLDTHVWIWMAADPDRLSTHARRHILNEDNELLLSAASTWEIAIKWVLGKLTLPAEPREFVAEQLRFTATSPLEIRHDHALTVATLPKKHLDPFDRMLIAQAQTEGVPILTGDPQFRRYDVDVIPA